MPTLTITASPEQFNQAVEVDSLKPVLLRPGNGPVSMLEERN